MKASDFHGDDDNHDRIQIEPEKQKDVDKLSAMFTTFAETMGDAMVLTRVSCVCDDPKIKGQNIGEGLSILSVAFGKFRGLEVCPTCCRKAAMLYRDAAQCMLDMIEEVEKQASEIENR